jgi:hypothetical protein
MNQILHNKKGQFVKGDPALVIHAKKVGHSLKGRKNTWGNKIGSALKGKKLSIGHKQKIKQSILKIGQTNTGRTHFKKGQKPHNFKGGISKTKEYRSFYKSQYKFQKRNATGSHTFGEWENLKAQYDWTCPSCRKSEPEIKLTEDHIIPLSRGGSNNIENIQPLCGSCNSKKWAKLISKYEYHTN